MSSPTDVSLLGKIASYTEILAKDPSSTVFVPLAETYRKMGLLDDALEIAERGVRQLPQFAPGYTALARVQAQRGDMAAAEAAFGRALEREPQSAVALKGLARVHLKKGERDGARKLLERVLAVAPEDEMAKKMLAAVGARLPAADRSGSDAVSEMPAKPGDDKREKPSPGNGGPISTPTIAELYVRQGYPKKAMRVFRDLLQDDPHNDEIRRKLVELKKQIEADERAVAGKTEEPSGQAFEGGQESQQAPDDGGEGHRQLQTVAALDRWLVSIRRRRDHVQ